MCSKESAIFLHPEPNKSNLLPPVRFLRTILIESSHLSLNIHADYQIVCNTCFKFTVIRCIVIIIIIIIIIVKSIIMMMKLIIIIIIMKINNNNNKEINNNNEINNNELNNNNN